MGQHSFIFLYLEGRFNLKMTSAKLVDHMCSLSALDCSEATN